VSIEFDPRWDWIEITAIGDRTPQYIKGMCRHTEVIPVESRSGEVVAQLCRTCDAQLPPP
jgi:hypothetical protein